ncbi:MAG TPA: sporulation protein YqfD [Candidatus Enterenecus stercoripullorum]|nr:sporulation protein YqfD [Candidatus Enterenecus stercoripullorum]
MKKLINLLLGYGQVRVTGAYPERLLNLCAQHRLPFWRLEWLDETTFTFRIGLRDLERLEELADRAMCQLQVLAQRGGGAAAGHLKKRWGFLLGLAICLAAVSVLSRFLLVVEVTGNETVPTAVILSELRRLGVRPGAYGPSIDEKETANEALIHLPQLSFLAINIYGTRAQVLVEEAVKAPQLLDEKTPADVVADVDGIILDIHASAGRAMFSDGDIVTKGEVLISGAMELYEPEGSSVDMGYLMVRAAGTVTARTWRTLEETIPLTTREKSYTGQEKKLYSLRFLWGQFDFFENSSISGGMYDKITQTDDLTLFGRTLPVGLTITTLREYTLEEGALEEAQAEEQLRQLLLQRLEAILGPGEGKVLRTDFVTRVEDGTLTVTLLAECEEEIGKTVEREGETGRIYGEGSAPEENE